MNKYFKTKNDKNSFIKDIFKKDKRGLQIGNLTFITKKEDYPKLRNILVKELGIKGILFNKGFWKNRKKKKK